MIASISWWWLLLFVALSAAMAILLYYSEKSLRDWKPWQKIVMAFIRFSFVFTIFFLLFAPLIKYSKSIVEKPIIVIAQDNSASVLMNFNPEYYKSQYIQDLSQFEKQLSENYEVHMYNYGESFRQDSVIDYSDDATNMSEIFTKIDASYAGMNLGAIIIAGDGIFNLGENPLYINKPQCVIYSIAMGDTLTSRDIYVKDVQHNKIAFYKNKFPVRILVGADKCVGENVKITISGVDGKLFEKTLFIDSDNYLNTIDAEIEASPKGLQEFKISLQPIEGEISIENNSRIFVVDVIDNRKNILILSNGAHPDIGAIVYALKNNSDYAITTKFITDASIELEKYQLIILHQIPSINNAAPQVIKFLKQSKTPALFILGEQTSLDAFNQINTGLTINTIKTSFDEAQPIISPDFNIFKIDDELNKASNLLPPLIVYFGDYKITANSNVLMKQRINTVTTNKPLLVFFDEGGARTGIISGEGIWRWRLHLFNISGNHDSFNNFIYKIIQYLAHPKSKQNLVVDSKRIFATNEAVILSAEFYNDAFELVNTNELSLIVTDKSGRETKHIFLQSNDYYTLNLGALSEGKYKYKANLVHNNKQYEAVGEFVVVDVSAEKLVNRANHDILYRLAAENNGKMFYPNQLDLLKQSINDNSNIVNRVYSLTKLLSLINLKLLFFIIIIFSSIEWFLRKYWGSY